MFSKYVEVYSTRNMTNFFKAKDLLAANGIVFKDASIKDQLRLSSNNIRGDRIALSRDGSMKALYRLLVKKHEEEKARQVLRTLSR